MIKDYLHNGTDRVVGGYEYRPVNNPHLLSGILGRALLLSCKQAKETYNEVRWTTQNAGKDIETTNLHATDPYVLQFGSEEIKGDRAKNTTSGWYFEASVPGLYRLTSNVKFKISHIDEAGTQLVYDNYIPTIDPALFGFYRNGVIINPQYNEIQMSTWNPHTATYPYHINTDRTSNYRFVVSHNIIYYLDEGDVIDVRAGILNYTGVDAVTLNHVGDVQITLLNNKENYVRVTYV